MKKKEKRFRKSYRRKPPKPIYQRNFFWPLIVIVFSGFLFTHIFLFLDFFWIKRIEISGAEKINAEKLREIIADKTTRNFYFLQSRSIFLFSPASLAREVVNEFPILAGLRLKKTYPDGVLLEVRERKPVGTFCGEECFLMDATGVIFEQVENRKALSIKTEKGNYSLGKRVVSRENVKFIVSVWNELKSDINLYEFHIDGMNLTVKTKENWDIFFNLDEDIFIQTLHLKGVLNDRIPKENRKNLSYIDLRFEGRVYYKYRN